jgi:ATP-dependent protease ClpP protease subunit
MTKLHVAVVLMLGLLFLPLKNRPGETVIVGHAETLSSSSLSLSFLSDLESGPLPRPSYRPPILKPGQHHVGAIKLQGEINPRSASEFINALEQINDAKAEFIVVEINSPGGRVDSGFLMSRAIEDSKVPVVCVVEGQADSMAFYLLQSCDVRMMTKRSLLMAHSPLVNDLTVSGSESRFKQIYDRLHALTEAMIQHYVHKSKCSVDVMRARCANGGEWWMNYQEALSLEMVDFIAPDMKSVIKVLTDHGTVNMMPPNPA